MTNDSSYSRTHEDFFVKHGDRTTYEKGEHIVWNKDESLWVFFLSEGLVRVSFSLPDGTRRIIGYFVPGNTFAQAGSFIASPDAQLEYLAEETVTTYRIPREIFLLQIDREPLFAQDFLNITLRNQRILLERIMYQGEKGVYRKCVRWLLFMVRYYSKKEDAGYKIIAPITQDIVADFLHVTRESVGGVLADLEEKKIVAFSKKSMVVLNDEKLHSLLKT